jgi:hypothetical protein
MAHTNKFDLGKWLNENKATNEIKVIPGNILSSIKQEVIMKLEAEYQNDPDFFNVDQNDPDFFNLGGQYDPYIDIMEMKDQIKLAQNIESLERIIFENLDDGYEFLFPIYRELLLKQ